MTTAQVVEVADAVVTELNSRTFGTPAVGLAAQKRYHAAYDADEVDGLKCWVFPFGEVWTQDSRATTLDEVRVAVAFVQKVDVLDVAAVETLVNLVDEVKRYLLPLLTPSWVPPGWTWRATEHDPLYDRRQLHETGIFRSTITLVYAR